MRKLKITKGNGWYKNQVGVEFTILQEMRTKYLVGEDLEQGNYFYVDKEDCEVYTVDFLEEQEKELLIKLIPNSEGKCVDFPVKLEQGDWIDLRANDYYSFEQGEVITISFGIACKLPQGYEAYIVPRSSLFRKYGLTLCNSVGIIDNSYGGNKDEWKGVFLANQKGILCIDFNERICQFRIQKNQPTLKLTQVDNLEGVNRGGFGEGTKNEK